MTKKISEQDFPSGSDDLFFEVYLTPEEDSQLRDLARMHQLDVSEFLRSRALESARNDNLRRALLQRAGDSTERILKVYKTAVENGAQPAIDEVSTVLLEMAEAYEQLAVWYGRQGVEGEYT